MTNNPQEKRKLQSKDMMVDALYRLMDKKPYEEITITELCQEADLSRRTFYRHFQVPTQVLEYSVEKFADEFILQYDVLSLIDKNLHDLAVMFFTFWSSRLDVLFLYQKNHLYYSLYEIFSNLIEEKITAKYTGIVSEKNLATAHFIGGGLWSLMDYWLQEGAQKTPEEMGDFIDMLYILAKQ